MVRTDGSEEASDWFDEGDPAAIDALKAILRRQLGQGYLVWWERREAERSLRARAGASGELPGVLF